MRMKLFRHEFNIHSVRAAVGAQLVARSQWYRATSCAPTTALALLISVFFVPATHAGELGRLFFTPEQRAQLDKDAGGSAGNSQHALILNGIVQRHGGKRTAWINGVPQAVGRSDERSPESVPVPLPGQNKSVKLKVGQRLLLNPAAGQDSAKSAVPAADMLDR